MNIFRKPLWDSEGEGGSGAGAGASPPGPGAGGASQPAGGDGSGGAAGNGDRPGGEPSPSNTSQQSRSSIMDFAGKSQSGAGDGEAWKLPEGVELPEHLVGASAEETLAKLAPAYRGARQELSTRKRDDGVLEGAVPKDLDGYAFEGDPEKDPVFKELMSEDSKPFLDAFRKKALEIGIPDKAFTALMEGGVRDLMESGKIQSLADSGESLEEMQRINGEAEYEALQRYLGGSAQADQAMAQVLNFKEQLESQGIFHSDAERAEFDQMFGTALAQVVGQRMLVAVFNQKPIPLGDAAEGAPTMAEAYEKQREALGMQPGADRDAAIKAADEAIAKATRAAPPLGSTPGKIRSSVL